MTGHGNYSQDNKREAWPSRISFYFAVRIMSFVFLLRHWM